MDLNVNVKLVRTSNWYAEIVEKFLLLFFLCTLCWYYCIFLGVSLFYLPKIHIAFALSTGQLPTNIFTFGSTRIGRQASSPYGFRKDITVLSSMGLGTSGWWFYYWPVSYWSSPPRILLPLHGWSWRVNSTLVCMAGFIIDWFFISIAIWNQNWLFCSSVWKLGWQH